MFCIKLSRNLRSRAQRHGLTLIELVVVLVVLIALASIIVPMLPNMLTRSHTSSASTNMAEIAKWLGSYEQLNLQFPDGWDSMVDGGTNTIATYVPVSDGTNTYISTYKLTATDGIAGTLTGSGIQNVYNFVTTPADPTFYPYGTTTSLTPTATPIATDTNLAVLTLLGAQKLNLNTGATYVVFGFGKKCGLVGTVAVDAPVHFSDDPKQSPQQVYARYAVVFKVTDSSGTPTGTATGIGKALPRPVLVSVVDLSTDEGISSIGDHIQEFYQTVNGSK